MCGRLFLERFWHGVPENSHNAPLSPLHPKTYDEMGIFAVVQSFATPLFAPLLHPCRLRGGDFPALTTKKDRGLPPSILDFKLLIIRKQAQLLEDSYRLLCSWQYHLWLFLYRHLFYSFDTAATSPVPTAENVDGRVPPRPFFEA